MSTEDEVVARRVEKSTNLMSDMSTSIILFGFITIHIGFHSVVICVVAGVHSVKLSSYDRLLARTTGNRCLFGVGFLLPLFPSKNGWVASFFAATCGPQKAKTAINARRNMVIWNSSKNAKRTP